MKFEGSGKDIQMELDFYYVNFDGSLKKIRSLSSTLKE
jgi:hypothetical protein